MKKRFLSLMLVFCMGMLLVVPAAAADNMNARVKKDMEAMQSARLFVDGMTVSEKMRMGRLPTHIQLQRKLPTILLQATIKMVA